MRETIEALGSKLVQIEEGDLGALSDLSDGLESLMKDFGAEGPAARIARAMLESLGASFKGAALDRSWLGKGFDLLVAATTDTVDEDIGIRIEEWLAAHAPSGGRAITQEGSKADPKADDRGDQQGKRTQGGTDAFSRSSEAFKLFLAEGRDRLSSAQALVLRIESNPDDAAAIDELFRVFHTFKGECGFFKLPTMGELSHAVENLLDFARKRQLVIDAQVADVLLASVDRLGMLLEEIERNEVSLLNDEDVADLRSVIERMAARLRVPVGEKLVAAGLISEADKVELLHAQKEASFTKTLGELTVERDLASKAEVEKAIATPAVARRAAADRAEQYIKVRAGQIDYLVDMIGELIIAEGQLEATGPAMAQLRKISREIQGAALKLRTTDLRSLAVSASRNARDISRELGKAVAFSMEGEDVEVDRGLVEGLSEPIMHIIRNAAHHGIESPEERAAAGKPPEGRIHIKAERRGNAIEISVEDDGRGLNKVAILDKAVERGIIGMAQAESMSDAEAYALIFLPGFSTAKEVGAISGRGVGMDVVKSFAAAHRGSVSLATERGRFTRVTMRFPVNTAIIDGMLVRVQGSVYVLPVANVVETIQLSRFARHEVGASTDVVDLRGEVLPVIDLDAYFGAPPSRGQALGIVIEDSNGKRYTLAVDEVLGKRETVIKPLGSRLGDLGGVSSGTVLSGGEVGLIIDVDRVVQGSAVQGGVHGER
jgi:two-component system chemotaxis sensor kinase CheA